VFVLPAKPTSAPARPARREPLRARPAASRADGDGAIPELAELLEWTIEQRGSDLHVKVGSVPHVRVDGHLKPAPFPAVTATATERIVANIMPADRGEDFEAAHEVDFAHSVPGLGRFRVHAYRQRGSVGLVFRRVPPGIPSFETLGLPAVVRRMAEEERGLLLVTGPTGAGKTTTVASMIDHINESRQCSILTIEDPIEVLHVDKQAIVSQREVGTDTHDYARAMARVTRHDPDVIMVGELRDPDTVWAALTAAENGHLVISTMRTTSVTETLARIVDFFPPFQQRQARMTLASALRGVVSQRLLERADGKGRVPAVEVLVSSNRVFDRIVDPEARGDSLEEIIAEGEYYGMQTFDQSLLHLYASGLVGLRDALSAATHIDEFRIALKAAGFSAD
jgi:twitching motility protein PilT